jgi:uracil-DNA glycosylase
MKMLAIQLTEREQCQDKTVEQITTECPPPGWIEVFAKSKPELYIISTILSRVEPWFPYKNKLFRAFDMCPLLNVKVVILGQDPYHSTENGGPIATGMSFSISRGVSVPSSLQNIYKELEREYPGEFYKPNHGDLTSWADQGVLLLNTCLTVAPHQAGSHMSKDKTESFWNGFINRVFDGISEVNPECVFLLWGSPAIKFGSNLNQRATKLVATHPSGLSANRASKSAPAFIGCNHFRMTNEYLVKQGKVPIDWRLF